MVATVYTPHGPDNLRIVLKAGSSPEKATMTVADLVAESQTPSKRSNLLKPSTKPNPTFLPPSYPQANISADPSNNILIHHLPNGHTSLIDLSWSRPPLPPDIPNLIFPLRIVKDGVAVAFSLTTETLISTPSDFRSIILTPDWVPKSDHQGLLLTSLRTFGLAREADVKTILDYMQSGRFNSAVHNGGEYTLDRCISILSLASAHAMSRIVDLVLLEMTREFLCATNSSSLRDQDQEQEIRPVDISAAQLDHLSRVRDIGVYGWIQNYIITIFRTPKTERVQAKNAVEECVGSQGLIAEGSSMLQRIMQRWFRDNPNPGRNKREGELARLRGLRVTRARSGSEEEGSPSVVGEEEGTPGSASPSSGPASADGIASASVRRGRGRGNVRVRGRWRGGRPRASSGTPTPASRFTGTAVMAAPTTPAARSVTERETPNLQPPSSVTFCGSPLKNQVGFGEMDVDGAAEASCQNKEQDKDAGEGDGKGEGDESSNEDDYGWKADLQRQKEAREGLHELLLSHLPL